jgi:hypothetical protein
MARKPLTDAHIDRRNRSWLSTLGVVLLAIGVVGLLLRAAVLVLPEPGRLWRDTGDAAVGYEWIVSTTLIVLGLILLWIGWRLLRSQFSSPTTPVHELTLQRQERGRTVVPADAVSRALARDVERLPGVQDASARLVGGGQRPHLVVNATVDGWSDMERVQTAIEEAYERLRSALGTSAVEADLHVRTVPVTHARVQ